ncbi:MAG: hypothetical protein N2318_03265 [Meiothermus sp.]|uniref:hypothetical protein n=1 Tax=Meiothermus sp. TaxID=1955249 RepID=UPI00298F11D9|nr:hypothetical protein [Meiothermus sp.]MCX7782646.1 hypothetical protein [Meiothermus sp.]MDW8482681.1 hypothetical protein [Meiothermus sp.]
MTEFELDKRLRAFLQGVLAQPVEERAGWALRLLEELDRGICLKNGEREASRLVHTLMHQLYDRWLFGRWA